MSHDNTKTQRKKRNVSNGVCKYKPPRPLTTTLAMRHTYCYRAAIAGVSNITRAELLNLSVIPYSTTPNTAYRLFASVRLVSIEAWFLPTTSYNSDSFTCRWISENGPERNVLEPVLGNAIPGYKKYVPPRDCFASMWNHSGYNESQALCTIVFPAGTILYLTVEVSVNETDTVSATSVTGWGISGFGSYFGRVAASFLEGPGSSTWVPQGVTGIN